MAENKALRAVVFDMDDTLLDWSEQERDWSKLYQERLRPIYDHLQTAGYPLDDLPSFSEIYNEQTHVAWSATGPPEWNAPQQVDTLRNTLRALGLPVGQIDVEHLQRLFAWDVCPGVGVFEDAIMVLRTLRSAGIRTGLVTNTSLPMWMRDVELQAFGLLEYLEVRLTAGDVGKIKPHPKPFQAVLEGLGVRPEEAIFVGDRPHDDVAGAQAAGMRAIWVRRKQRPKDGRVKPDATISSLAELLDVLDDWYPGWR